MMVIFGDIPFGNINFSAAMTARPKYDIGIALYIRST